ncbi:hypothetical protein PsorP6_009461 [Peronosclerospora sorghi]|uniref:Uncharacterized protein n=1 Tax=Peronosclerospora sorghi TaxID=230839 RepID=A0ACC0W0N1_9STRA|nr:hypothetical protein PsorP6_009461 [Peronosclerospora sorghi]
MPRFFLRFGPVVVSIIALAALRDGVSANIVVNPGAHLSSEQTNGEDVYERQLKRVELAEDEDSDERAFDLGSVEGLRALAWRLNIGNWGKARIPPNVVSKMLQLRAKKIDWGLAAAYALYFRNLKYGPYVVDKLKKLHDEDENV